MAHAYYIDAGGAKDGPHDLLTMMRRIRAGKIAPDTSIFVDEETQSRAATQIHDISLFFVQSHRDTARPQHPTLLLTAVIRDSARFTFEHHVMMAYAGAMVLLTILLAAALMHALGNIVGGLLSWMLFMLLHYLFCVCVLRLYRMQPFSQIFINQELACALPMLCIGSILVALMLFGGIFLLLIPSFLVAIYYAFVPFLIFDRHMKPVEAMYASRLLVWKHSRRCRNVLIVLLLLYVLSLLLIVPAPVTIPIFSVALARLYEELTTS